MVQYRYFFILILTSTLLFISACKEKKTNPGQCKINPSSCQTVLAAKEFFLFKVGTWWVYEEETSLERDSLYVYESINSSYWEFDVRIQSANSGYIYHYWPIFLTGVQGCSETQPVAKKCVLIKRSKYKTLDFVAENYAFFVQHNLGDSLGSANYYYPNNFIYINNIFNLLSVQGDEYQQVIKIFEPHSAHEKNNATNHYYTKGVGLIRKELLDSNQVWNLVNYHIEQ